MQDFTHRGFQTEVASVPVETGVVSKALRVPAEINLIIGLIEIAEAGDQFPLVIPLKSRPRNDVEHAIRPVAIFGAVTPALDFEIINIFRIKLRTHVAGDVCVGHRNVVQEPAYLLTA